MIAIVDSPLTIDPPVARLVKVVATAAKVLKKFTKPAKIVQIRKIVIPDRIF